MPVATPLGFYADVAFRAAVTLEEFDAFFFVQEREDGGQRIRGESVAGDDRRLNAISQRLTGARIDDVRILHAPNDDELLRIAGG